MRTLELKGFKSYRAFQAFHTLMLGLKMLPAYLGEDYKSFYDRIKAMPPKDQETMVREAALFVNLQKEEMDAILAFALDPNGVPYGAENMGNLGPKEMHEAIVAVCCEIGKIEITLVSDSEKKK